MKVRCDRIELADALNALLGIVPPTQTARPILLNFYLRTDDDRLSVEAMDLDIGARMTIEHVEVLEAGELTLPAGRLTSLVRELPDRNIGIESSDSGHGAYLRAEGYELKILGEDPEEFPRVPSPSVEQFMSVDRDQFLESLRRVAIASSHDPARYQLTGVFFEVEEDRLTLTATDGKRLTNDVLRIGNESGAAASGIVPNRAVDIIMKVVGQGDPQFKFTIAEADIHLSFGRGEFSSKLIQGKYPDYRWVLSAQANLKVKAKRSDLMAAVRSASLMTDRETSTIQFHFGADTCRLTTQAANIGESRIEVPVSSQGDRDIEIRFNPNYFIDALRCVADEDVRLEFDDSDKPGTIRGRQNYRHLIMPLVAEKAKSSGK
jgi:DNA polymerase-3 subunit beta